MMGRERELEGRACGLADRVHVFVCLSDHFVYEIVLKGEL